MTPPEGGATGGGGSASVIEGEWLDGADGDGGGSAMTGDNGGGAMTGDDGGSAPGISSGGEGDGVTPGSLLLAALLLLALIVGIRRRPSRAKRPTAS